MSDLSKQAERNPVASGYTFAMEVEEGDAFKRYLQGLLNAYHETAYPLMTVPQAKLWTIRMRDAHGQLVGGAQIWIYWGWVEISILALEPELRGRGLGRALMAVIEDKARQEGCRHSRVEAFEKEAGFYQRMGYRIVGELKDYPEGTTYCWLRKELA